MPCGGLGTTGARSPSACPNPSISSQLLAPLITAQRVIIIETNERVFVRSMLGSFSAETSSVPARHGGGPDMVCPKRLLIVKLVSAVFSLDF